MHRQREETLLTFYSRHTGWNATDVPLGVGKGKGLSIDRVHPAANPIVIASRPNTDPLAINVQTKMGLFKMVFLNCFIN